MVKSRLVRVGKVTACIYPHLLPLSFDRFNSEKGEEKERTATEWGGRYPQKLLMPME